jgi:hypothetical protein
LGSDPRGKRLSFGHFAAGRWQLTSPQVSTDRPKVLVSGEGLQYSRSTSSARYCMRPAGTATGPVVPATWRGTALYGNDPRARYFLDLDIYSNEPIPAAGGPA